MPQQAPALLYRMEDVEIDPSKASLVKGGVTIHVRPKTLSLLYYLIGNRDRIVTKEELLEKLWAGTAVTEDALTQCVSELRKILGDDPKKPRFVRTVPKQGFVFIGEVQTVAAVGDSEDKRPVTPELEERSATAAAAAPASVPDQPGEAGGSTEPTSSPFLGARQPMTVAAGGAVLVILLLLAAAAAWKWGDWRDQVAASGSKVTVAILPFENRSGRQDLEWMQEGLPDMLTGSLARSARLSIIPGEQISSLLQRAKLKNPGLEQALDLSNRARAQYLILGAFTVLGEATRLDLRIYRSQGGQLLASEVLTVDRPDDLLTRFDSLAIRAALALQAPLPSSRDGLAAEARTANIEAYRLYMLGVERADQVRPSEAIALLQRAVELDPGFHMARARIGYVYTFPAADSAGGQPYLDHAMANISRFNRRDRLFVEAWHAFAHDRMEAAIQKHRRIVDEYPGEIGAHVALARLLRGERKHEEAIEVLNRALSVDPDWADAHNLASGIFFEMGQREKALQSALRYTEIEPMEANSHDTLGIISHRMGRYEDALRCFQHALALKLDFEVSMIHMGNTLVHLGRYREAVEWFRRFIATTPSPAQRERGHQSIAWIFWKQGNTAAALQELSPASIGNPMPTTLTMRQILSPQPSQEDSIGEIFRKRSLNGRGARLSYRWEHVLAGWYALQVEKNAGAAIQQMQKGLMDLPPFWMQTDLEDILAETYLQLGRSQEAATEYQRVVRLHPNLASAHYGLGLALERVGNHEGSRAALRRFLEIWKDADENLPERLEAQRRLSAGK